MGRAKKVVTKIEFSGDVVTVFEDDNMMWAEHAQRVAQSLFGLAAAPNEPLPMAVRWIGPSGRHWLFERPPSPMTVVFGGNEYRIRLPWTVMMVDVRVGRVWAYARSTSIGGPDSELCQLPLPGISTEGQLPILRMPTGYPAETMLNNAYSQLSKIPWKGEVADDFRPPELRDLDMPNMLHKWGKGTALQVVDWGWVPRTTLGELVASISQDESEDSVRTLIEQAVKQA